MCPRRTWIAGAALLAAVVLGACSGGTGGVSVGSGGRDELFAETASFEVIAAKPQRIMVGLSTKDGRVVHGGTVRLTLRPAAGGGAALRVTAISPGYVRTELAGSMSNPALRAQTLAGMEGMAIAPEAIARAIAFAIEQPADVDVGEIVVRPTAQG